MTAKIACTLEHRGQNRAHPTQLIDAVVADESRSQHVTDQAALEDNVALTVGTEHRLMGRSR
jgi:hypothetical protein